MRGSAQPCAQLSWCLHLGDPKFVHGVPATAITPTDNARGRRVKALEEDLEQIRHHLKDTQARVYKMEDDGLPAEKMRREMPGVIDKNTDQFERAVRTALKETSTAAEEKIRMVSAKANKHDADIGMLWARLNALEEAAKEANAKRKENEANDVDTPRVPPPSNKRTPAKTKAQPPAPQPKRSHQGVPIQQRDQPLIRIPEKQLGNLSHNVVVWCEITATMRRAEEHNSFGARVYSAQVLVLLVEVVLG